MSQVESSVASSVTISESSEELWNIVKIYSMNEKMWRNQLNISNILRYQWIHKELWLGGKGEEPLTAELQYHSEIAFLWEHFTKRDEHKSERREKNLDLTEWLISFAFFLCFILEEKPKEAFLLKDTRLTARITLLGFLLNKPGSTWIFL